MLPLKSGDDAAYFVHGINFPGNFCELTVIFKHREKTPQIVYVFHAVFLTFLSIIS
jgi:hypothetical protein